jgi:hypothetical protein
MVQSLTVETKTYSLTIGAPVNQVLSIQPSAQMTLTLATSGTQGPPGTAGVATSTVSGTVEIFSDTTQSVASNAVTTTASRTYGLQLNADGQGVINVPWTDTSYTLVAATATTLGGIELFDGTVQSVASNVVTATASRTYGLQLNASGQAVINVPWTDTVVTLDAVPTDASTNGVESNGVFDALALKQDASLDLTAIDALAGTSGFLKKAAADTWALDTSTYLTSMGSLDSLSDVVITTPATGSTLTFDGTNWIDSVPTGGGTSPLTASVTKTVGSGGDYATIQLAIDYFMQTYHPDPSYPSAVATISILSGTTITSSVSLGNSLDCSWIIITAVSNPVSVQEASLGTGVFNISNGAKSPRIGCTFSSNGTTSKKGGYVTSGGTIIFDGTSGFTGFGSNALSVIDKSRAIGLNSNTVTLTSAGAEAVLIDNGSIAQFYNITATATSRAISMSVSSELKANGITASAATGMQIYGSSVYCNTIVANSCSTYGILCSTGSEVTVGSTVSATGCGTGIRLTTGSTIRISGTGTITGCTTNGILCSGGHAIVNKCNFRMGGSDATTDIAVTYGGIIHAGEATGGVSQTANTVTASGLIIK